MPEQAMEERVATVEAEVRSFAASIDRLTSVVSRLDDKIDAIPQAGTMNYAQLAMIGGGVSFGLGALAAIGMFAFTVLLDRTDRHYEMQQRIQDKAEDVQHGEVMRNNLIENAAEYEAFLLQQPPPTSQQIKDAQDLLAAKNADALNKYNECLEGCPNP